MCCGDFNSRTGLRDDFIENPNCSNNLDLTIKSRINWDEVSNTHGESMWDLCKNTGLRICNGRLGEDCDKGDFTFYCRRGRSVVDYLLTPYNLLNLIFNFQIGLKHIDSDHGPITFTLQIFSHFTNEKLKPLDANVEDHRPRYIYKWCPEKQSEYQVALRSSKCLDLIENLACDLCTQINTLIETAVNGLF